MPTPRRTAPRRATTAKKLLTESLAGIGPAALAHAAGVSVERLEHWSTSAYRMTTAERAAVAVAVIAMAPQSSVLFRDALNLRAQVCAAMDYEAGVTVRGSGPARIRF